MPGMKFQFDEEGGPFFYFLVSVYTLVLIPVTYYFWPRTESKKKSTTERECQCAGCIAKRKLKEAQGPWKKAGRYLTMAIFVGAWGLCVWLMYRVSKVQLEWTEFDPYKELGLDQGADPSEIKRAYRQLSLIHHPDRGGDTATFTRIAKAYESLTDEETRKNLEEFGNPDGPQALQFGIALPAWLIDKRNARWIVVVYLGFFLIFLPLLVGTWWYSSIKKNANSVLINTTQLFFYYLRRTPANNMPALLKLLSGSFEFDPSSNPKVVLRSTDNQDLSQLLREFPEARVEQRNLRVALPYATKTRVLLYAYLNRHPLPRQALQSDLDYILQKTSILLRELVNIINEVLICFRPEKEIEHRLQKTLLNIILLEPYLVQGLFPKASLLQPILQLPHLDEELEHHLQLNRRPLRHLEQLARLTPGERRRVFLEQCALSLAQYTDICGVLAAMPHLKIEVEPRVVDARLRFQRLKKKHKLLLTKRSPADSSSSSRSAGDRNAEEGTGGEAPEEGGEEDAEADAEERTVRVGDTVTLTVSIRRGTLSELMLEAAKNERTQASKKASLAGSSQLSLEELELDLGPLAQSLFSTSKINPQNGQENGDVQSDSKSERALVKVNDGQSDGVEGEAEEPDDLNEEDEANENDDTLQRSGEQGAKPKSWMKQRGKGKKKKGSKGNAATKANKAAAAARKQQQPQTPASSLNSPSSKLDANSNQKDNAHDGVEEESGEERPEAEREEEGVGAREGEGGPEETSVRRRGKGKAQEANSLNSKSREGEREKGKGKGREGSESERDSASEADEEEKGEGERDEKTKRAHQEAEEEEWRAVKEQVRKHEPLELKDTRTHIVHCPYYPHEKYEWWYAYVIERRSNHLATLPIHPIKTLRSHPPSKDAAAGSQLEGDWEPDQVEEIKMLAPSQPGTYQYTLHIRSDSYIDRDIQHNFILEILPALEIEKKKKSKSTDKKKKKNRSRRRKGSGSGSGSGAESESEAESKSGGSSESESAEAESDRGRGKGRGKGKRKEHDQRRSKGHDKSRSGKGSDSEDEEDGSEPDEAEKANKSRALLTNKRKSKGTPKSKGKGAGAQRKSEKRKGKKENHSEESEESSTENEYSD